MLKAIIEIEVIRNEAALIISHKLYVNKYIFKVIKRKGNQIVKECKTLREAFRVYKKVC